MSRKMILLCMVGILVCFFVGGCKKSSEAEMLPVGMLLEFGECKDFQPDGGTLAVPMVSRNSDCIEYQYDGRGTLTLKHINAEFNCEPGEITAEFTFSENTITITERESQGIVDCLCLFDLDYQLTNLSPGRYTLRVVEPYVGPNQEQLELILELFKATSGIHCVERNYYPWGE